MIIKLTITWAHVSQYRDLTPVEVQAGRDAAVAAMSGAFGGCTLVDSMGAWVDTSGVVWYEPGTTLWTYTDMDQAVATRILRDVAKDVRDLMHQTCVLVAVEPVAGLDFV